MERAFSGLAAAIAHAAGSAWAAIAAVALVVAWALAGSAWAAAFSICTSVVTFLMLFVILATQNRDTAALHVKLNELVRAIDTARNQYIGIEAKTEAEIKTMDVTPSVHRQPEVPYG